MLFGWAPVVLLGACLNYLADSPAPMSTLPMIWLLALAWMIERMMLAEETF